MKGGKSKYELDRQRDCFFATVLFVLRASMFWRGKASRLSKHSLDKPDMTHPPESSTAGGLFAFYGARSPSGKAKVCKTFIGGSIPPRASKILSKV